MKRYLILILVMLVLALPLGGCWPTETTPTNTDVPTMSAVEVCQYVNQALPNEYTYNYPARRYEYRYTALSAQYIGGGSHKGEWEVSVRKTVELQRLYEGQWTIFPNTSPQSQTVEYIFNEVTGAVTPK